MLDPFAGGGSIPFEALRYGFITIANDLNPVAAVILKATLDYPARFGPGLADDIRKWGDIWATRVKEKLAPYFPKQPGESIFAYLWARTVACPTTGKPVPLSPNWWLSTGDDPVAVRLIAEPDMAAPRFEIVTGAKARAAHPDEGTVSRGVGRSPWTGETISGDYIKAEAQAGRMGQILYAIATKGSSGSRFRPPDAEDLAAIRSAEAALVRQRAEWGLSDSMPSEEIGISNYDRGHRLYGTYTWADFFAPRQLFAMATCLSTFRGLQIEAKEAKDTVNSSVALTYLALALDKAASYNTRYARFDPERGIENAFEQHNFRIKWSFSEFDASTNLVPWVAEQVIDAYRQIALLLAPAQAFLLRELRQTQNTRLDIRQGSAASLSSIPDSSVHNITVDPPYYDNVQYAELSDFFYIWLKRSVGHLFPEFFRDELTNKDDEAVANPARFAALGSKKSDLAKADYERKMAAAFREMHRVLRRRRLPHRDVHPQTGGRVGHPGLGPHRRGVHRQGLVARPHRERAQPAPGAEERSRVHDPVGVPEAERGDRCRRRPGGLVGRPAAPGPRGRRGRRPLSLRRRASAGWTSTSACSVPR